MDNEYRRKKRKNSSLELWPAHRRPGGRGPGPLYQSRAQPSSRTGKGWCMTPCWQSPRCSTALVPSTLKFAHDRQLSGGGGGGERGHHVQHSICAGSTRNTHFEFPSSTVSHHRVTDYSIASEGIFFFKRHTTGEEVDGLTIHKYRQFFASGDKISTWSDQKMTSVARVTKRTEGTSSCRQRANLTERSTLAVDE